ncbi:PREDICTED: uncharacterized protein LOC109463284 [Branchiostoma belcheri]|uniref:Uncharacterized protein LOC109463284 n=1 Tax=Branchiostoma belcheri TaxID=7741 RepID=A0A6P4XYS8_BRABE|nr:PREDICTED: uncharacterized protein LOC109463284 [Branchiostoma belcheri]
MQEGHRPGPKKAAGMVKSDGLQAELPAPVRFSPVPEPPKHLGNSLKRVLLVSNINEEKRLQRRLKDLDIKQNRETERLRDQQERFVKSLREEMQQEQAQMKRRSSIPHIHVTNHLELPVVCDPRKVALEQKKLNGDSRRRASVAVPSLPHISAELRNSHHRHRRPSLPESTIEDVPKLPAIGEDSFKAVQDSRFQSLEQALVRNSEGKTLKSNHGDEKSTTTSTPDDDAEGDHVE